MRVDKQLIVLGLIQSGRYTVDADNGRVISLIGKEPRIMKPNVLPSGYEQLTLDMGFGGRFNAYTHQVVYLYKYGVYNPDYTIDHIDREKGNNKITNLRCVSYTDNIANSDNSRNTGKGKPRKTEQEKDIMVKLYKEGFSIAEIAKQHQCARQNVYVILTNRGCNIKGKQGKANV